MREMSDDQRPSFREIESVVEQAEKYRLGTARLPIDSLSPQWHSGNGTNRQINQKHAMTLARVFYEEGLKRKSPENHLIVGCSRSQVDAMLQVLASRSSGSAAGERNNTRMELERAMQSRVPQNQQDDVREWPLFDGWEAINGKAELMPGNTG